MSQPSFSDHFSKQAGDYAQYRPHYPAVLFEYLASLPAHRDWAWDCGTGNGQAALGLAPYFEHVLATDPSQAQIRQAIRHTQVLYGVANAENAPVMPAQFDLITVAQALHWFRLHEFYQEVRRVLKPEGVIVVWCYERCTISREIDEIVDNYYQKIVGPYWPPERRWVEEGYRLLPFPFRSLKVPEISMELAWNAEELLGYLRSWSATQRYEQAQGRDPLEWIADSLRQAWGTPEQSKVVSWPLQIRAGTLM